MSFKNDEELKKAMAKALSGSSLIAMNQTTDMLQNQIDRVVYHGYTPEVYEDTFEFLDAWEVGSYEDAGAEVFYNPDYLSINAPVHASVVTGMGVASVLADWIFEGNSGGLFGNGGWNRARNAWEELDKEMTKTKFRNMYEDAMTTQGIAWKRSIGGVQKIKE